jgi:hypothetical protein
MLKVQMQYGPVMAKLGSMVAYQGDVRFQNTGSGGLNKMLKSKMTGEGVNMMTCEGTGELFVADEDSEDDLKTAADVGPSNESPDTIKIDLWQMIISSLCELPKKMQLVMTAYFWVISPLHFRKDIALNNAIAERIRSTTGQTFTPESIGVDRSRGIKLLRQAIKRRYPDAKL